MNRNFPFICLTLPLLCRHCQAYYNDLVRIKTVLRAIGIVGVVVCLVFFLRAPSWPTPDKLLIFLTFLFMSFGQALEMLKRLGPFVLLLLIYESFRGIAPHLNRHVNFMFLPEADRFLFGGTLPTVTLQHWLWHGSVQWYDFMLYGAYMLHFILPIGLAILVWKQRAAQYWRVVMTYVVLSFAGFFTFLVFPAAPPWMASNLHLIPDITHVSSYVWQAMGIHDVTIIYNKFSPNPVAALPSLHAAYATLFALFIYKLFGRKWGLLACLYPAFIYFGTVYMGEHYAIDEVVGALYAFGAYALTIAFFTYAMPKLRPWLKRHWVRLKKETKQAYTKLARSKA